jgi:hypothetical protein
VDRPDRPAYTPASMRRHRFLRSRSASAIAVGLLVACGALALPTTLSGQSANGGDAVRFGISFGGVSTAGLTVEFVRDNRSLDLTVGTWSFRDVSVSIVAKQYLGSRALQPFVGAGFWLVGASPPDGRLGLAAVFRVPVGLDWGVIDDHAIGMTVNVNRALWVRRTDPEDDLPLNHRLVPLPGVYYKYTR